MQASPIRVNVLGHGIVEFPAGTSEETMRQALASLSAPQPAAPQAPASYGYGDYARRSNPKGPADEGLKNVQNAAPAIASIGAAYATGGLSIPVQMAAVGGAGIVGQAIKDASESMPTGERFTNMALEGIKQAALTGVVGKVAEAAPRMAQAGRNLWNRVAKVPETVVKKTQTMRAGGSLAQGKDEIAETVLSQGRGTIRTGNAEALQDQLNALDDAVSSIVASSPGMVSRQELRSALQSQLASISRGSHEAETTVAALKQSLTLLNQKPAKMTVQAAQDFKRQIYASWEKTFSADAAQGAKASADKVVARAARSAIAREEPAIGPLNEQMSRLIPAVSAMNKAVSRTSNHDPVRLSQMLAGVVTNPVTVAGALLNHPKIGGFTAQQIYKAAERLPKAARTAANIIRLAGAMTPAASHEMDADALIRKYGGGD